MSIERMTDRMLTLAQRVEAAWAIDPYVDGARAALGPLLHDIAAADRLARACSAFCTVVDESPLPDHGMSAATAAEYEMDQAEEAYRARMAQGVDRG